MAFSGVTGRKRTEWLHRFKAYIGYTDSMSSGSIQFETTNLRWDVSLERKVHHTTATVVGRTSNTTPTARHEEFTITESDQDTLFDRIRAEVVRRDGPIVKGNEPSE